MFKLGIIGAGNMAKAIVNGIIVNNVLKVGDILISDPFCEENLYGVVNIKNNKKLFTECEYIILAIKPQTFELVAREMQEFNKAKYIITIMAGLPASAIKKYARGAQVVRVMPNTPCKIGFGMSAIANIDMEKSAKDFIFSVFKSMGDVSYISENMFDAVTSVSGSGPAYAYMFIEGMIKSAISNGLDYETAKKMVVATVIGASEMVKSSSLDIESLISAVCSKGGTTLEAVNTFKNTNFEKIIAEAMQNCYNRSIELGKPNN